MDTFALFLILFVAIFGTAVLIVLIGSTVIAAILIVAVPIILSAILEATL